MKINILINDLRWSKTKLQDTCERSFGLAMSVSDEMNFNPEVSILACNDKEICELNEKFRGQNSPTNILSWPEYELKSEIPGQPPRKMKAVVEEASRLTFIGNLAISFDRCSTESKESEITFDDHMTHILLHGCLHLLGFDHQNDLDANLMEGMEINLLSSIGIKNPYYGNYFG